MGIGLDASVLTNSEEYESVDSCLDRIVQLALCDVPISQRDISCESFAPALDFLQKFGVDLSGASSFPAGRGIFVE